MDDSQLSKATVYQEASGSRSARKIRNWVMSWEMKSGAARFEQRLIGFPCKSFSGNSWLRSFRWREKREKREIEGWNFLLSWPGVAGGWSQVSTWKFIERIWIYQESPCSSISNCAQTPGLDSNHSKLRKQQQTEKILKRKTVKKEVRKEIPEITQTTLKRKVNPSKAKGTENLLKPST